MIMVNLISPIISRTEQLRIETCFTRLQFTTKMKCEIKLNVEELFFAMTRNLIPLLLPFLQS